MQIDVLLAPQLASNRELGEKRVVVLDILRATSTITTALANQALAVIPVVEPVEATDLARSIGLKECVVGGERKGLKIEGFELGNSPLEYTKDQVGGKKVILCTTNGTKAIKWAQGAAEVLIGSLLNFQTLVEYLKTKTEDLVIVCSGRDSNMSMEDLACAGLIIEALEQMETAHYLTDPALLALYTCEHVHKVGLKKFISQTEHGRYLAEIGLAEDVAICSSLAQYSILPRLVDGQIKI